MSSIKNRTAQQLQTLLEQALNTMTINEKNGNYVEAQNNRINVQQLKKDLELRQVYEMELRHKQENQQITKAHQEELGNFNSFWDKKSSDFEIQAQKLQNQMMKKHESQIEKMKQQLQKQLPLKVKQSSQCLNLRKMQQHMVKQKNYAEAHKVQQRILQIEKQEKQSWINNRNTKMQTSLNTLRAKQSAELNNLKKRIKSGMDQQKKDRINEEMRLKQKYNNVSKQLKSQQDKEVLNFKGHFKSKGGQSSPLTKSKFLGSR